MTSTSFHSAPTFDTPNTPFSASPLTSLNPTNTVNTAPFYARPLPTGVSSGSANSYTLPPHVNNYPSSFQSSVDPAQFIWAVSSRLPTVEESSPNDEQKSTVSGPSPNRGDPTSKPKRPTKKAEALHEKIVKVTWWRPHGQTAIAPGALLLIQSSLTYALQA